MKRIVIEGPGKNALGTDLMVRLREEVAAGAGEGLLFVGSGDAFSAGLDLKEVASLDLDGMDRFLRRLQDRGAGHRGAAGEAVTGSTSSRMSSSI